jgi:HD-GYP domain-containing protein (c-di-GMP phosphodiesterase class II)
MSCEVNVREVQEIGRNPFGGSLRPFHAIARDLAREFGAPVGLLDPETELWCAAEGAPVAQFPAIDEWLQARSRSDEWRMHHAIVWRRPEDRDRNWLILLLPGPHGREVVAFLGFKARDPLLRSAGQPAEGTPDRMQDTLPFANGAARWGPNCPERALWAWGREVASRYWAESTAQERSDSRSPKPSEESERQVIGRLIRRLRISDAPQAYQAMATTVLRTSLNMAAVAWVPKDSHQQVVVSGTVEGLSSQAYRVFPSPAGRESTFISRDAGAGSIEGAPPGVRRYASVAAGSLGWLLAVNPLDDRTITSIDIERLQYVASLIATQLSNGKIYADLKELLFGIIRALAAAIDAKDPYTSGHSERVARIAVRLAEELGMPAPKRSDLYLAGLLHDVGKIGIDDVVLKKTGPLTPEEYRKIQLHVEIGVTILKDLKKLHHILPGVKHHHESMDGTGYPDHLSGDDIPMEARILAVADAFDAMSSNRPYRKQLSPAQIDKVFHEGRNVQWDPDVLDALFACRGDLEAIRQKGLGESLIGAVDVTLGRT